MSASLYRIAEDTGSRLVLKGRTVGLWLLTAFLLLNAAVLLWVGLVVASPRQLVPRIGASALGLFFAVCGLAAFRQAVRYRARIEVDRDATVVQLATGDGPASVIAFADLAAIEVEVLRRRGPGGRSSREHRVFLHDAAGNEWLIDRSADGARMEALADRLRALTGVPDGGRRAGRGRGAPAATAPAAEGEVPPGASAPPATAAGADGLQPPPGISIEADAGATVYAWRTLPRTLFWAFFWAFVTLFLGGLTGLCLAGMAAALGRQPAGVTVVFLLLAAATLGLGYVASRHARSGRAAWLGLALVAVILANLLLGVQPFIFLGVAAALLGYVTSLCAFVLLARCRLRLSGDGLRYEERILGLPLAWRRRSLAATEVEGFHLRAAVRGGGAIRVRTRHGPSFNLMIPQGPGAFSRPDLDRLRRRWLLDLGRQS